MKLHRFIGDFILSKNEVEITKPEIIKQIKGVLRLKEGESVVLSDGLGSQVEAKITSLAHDKIICEIIRKLESSEPKKKVSLCLAILKKENFELAVQKAVECGVSEIIPIITERTIKTGLNMERLNKIILEASEQCERSVVPNLHEIIKFEDAIKGGGNSSASLEKIIFTPSLASDRVNTENSTEYTPSKNTNSASIFIGPEGGFTEKEISLAQENGYTVASLGNLILRGETAAIVATYRVVNGV